MDNHLSEEAASAAPNLAVFFLSHLTESLLGAFRSSFVFAWLIASSDPSALYPVLRRGRRLPHLGSMSIKDNTKNVLWSSGCFFRCYSIETFDIVGSEVIHTCSWVHSCVLEFLRTLAAVRISFLYLICSDTVSLLTPYLHFWSRSIKAVFFFFKL